MILTLLAFSPLLHSFAASVPVPVPGAELRERYPLRDATQKLVSNTGTGFAPLYGTRNFRAVLNGVYYRGGANNLFFEPKRPNSNPLPEEGLSNLCKEGFGHAVYLYPTNYSSSPRQVRCTDRLGNSRTLEYLQISPLAFRDEDLRRLLALIFEHIRNPRLGAIYDHCWNGWHASGYVAASALQQFCGFDSQSAIRYWNLNTDGNNGDSYERIRERIRAFRPVPELTLTSEEKTLLCPAPGSFEYASSPGSP